MMHTKKDSLFAEPLDSLGDWTFDANVADVFPDMIKRSVPGYANIISMIGMLAKRFATENSNIYDLGCSLGEATLAIRRNIATKNCNIYAIDNSRAMIERCDKYVNSYKAKTPVNIICGDINEIEMQNASLIILNFTLQFIEQSKRQALINKIYNALNQQGVLIVSEKFSFSDAIIDNLLFNLHYDFKRLNGYSELEISQKRSLLENVMITDTIKTHQERLKNAGFSHMNTWYQCLNFGSIIAIK